VQRTDPERAKLASLKVALPRDRPGKRAMPATQPTAAEHSRQDAFRWTRTEVANAFDHFSNPDHPSQRETAERLGIPHATFNYWTRHYSPADGDPIDSFFRSAAGELLLRRLLTSALVVFQQRGACGIRLVGEFLRLAQLDRFVACSRGALAPLAAHLESDLVAFRDGEQPPLAQQMKPRAITLVPDEHFHSGKPCLVAIEPVSNFIAVECYRDRRDADTWKQAITEGTADMPVEVIQLTSDLARALVCCAEKGLEVIHSPDLFHGQRDLLRPVLLPMNRPIQQAEKDLEKAERLTAKFDVPEDQPQAMEELLALIEAVRQEENIRGRLQTATASKEEAVRQVRGIGDDYHPFDRETGAAVTAEEVGKRLNRHLDELQEVTRGAKLSGKAQEAVNKARGWVTALVGCVAWFWSLVGDRLEEMDLTQEQEEVVKNKLLSGKYWEMAAGRARTGEERQRLKQMAQELSNAARQDATLSALPEEEKKQVEEVAQESAGLFQRSSSCVEGRNGRLSLQHHGHGRVSERRLKALTVIHNYMVKRADGTTAAQRFFGQQHKDVFSWLLERMPDLPRPAQKRPKPAAQGLPCAGSPD
jgi:hypothetical protein